MMANKNLIRPLKAVNNALLEILLDACAEVPGDFMEMGVWNGLSFDAVYYRGLKYNRQVHAVDTFSGMPESPIAADNERYPPGMVDSGGADEFREKYPSAIIHQGMVPDILSSIDVKTLAFVHLDIDHEFSTRPALDWVWPRLTTDGILIVHDFGLQVDKNASKAVKDWMAENDLNYVGITDNTIFFRKGVS